MKTKHPQAYEAKAGEWIYGYHPVANALRRGRIARLMLLDGSPAPLAMHENMANVSTVSWKSEQFERAFGSVTHQGIAAECRPLTLHGEETLKSETVEKSDEKYPLYLLLDGITDPHNFGACLRSAAAFNCKGVIFEKRNSAELNGACCKASAGMIEWLKLFRVSNLIRALGHLQKAGYWAISTSSSADQTFNASDLNMPAVLIMGSEGKGVHAGLMDKADMNLRIDMSEVAESLNVSAATAVCLYAIRSQGK